MTKYSNKADKRTVPVSTSLTPEVAKAIEAIARKRGWSRANAYRNLIEGLLILLQREGLDKGDWISLTDFELVQLSDKFTKVREKDK